MTRPLILTLCQGTGQRLTEGSVMSAQREVRICEDAAALALQTTEAFVRLAQESVAARGRFTVALAGGSTPKAAYAMLVSAAYRAEITVRTKHGPARVLSDFVFFGIGILQAGDGPSANGVDDPLLAAGAEHEMVPQKSRIAGSPPDVAAGGAGNIVQVAGGQPPVHNQQGIGGPSAGSQSQPACNF